MTRNTIGTARYGLTFFSGEMAVIHAVALIQALTYCSERPKRACVFEGGRAIGIDDDTLEKCWKKSQY
jgi:hypothetical protein